MMQRSRLVKRDLIDFKRDPISLGHGLVQKGCSRHVCAWHICVWHVYLSHPESKSSSFPSPRLPPQRIVYCCHLGSCAFFSLPSVRGYYIPTSPRARERERERERETRFVSVSLASLCCSAKAATTRRQPATHNTTASGLPLDHPPRSHALSPTCNRVLCAARMASSRTRRRFGRRKRAFANQRWREGGCWGGMVEKLTIGGNYFHSYGNERTIRDMLGITTPRLRTSYDMHVSSSIHPKP